MGVSPRQLPTVSVRLSCTEKLYYCCFFFFWCKKRSDEKKKNKKAKTVRIRHSSSVPWRHFASFKKCRSFFFTFFFPSATAGFDRKKKRVKENRNSSCLRDQPENVTVTLHSTRRTITHKQTKKKGRTKEKRRSLISAIRLHVWKKKKGWSSKPLLPPIHHVLKKKKNSNKPTTHGNAEKTWSDEDSAEEMEKGKRVK